MFCHKCGTQAVEVARSCASCGTALFQSPNDGDAQLVQGQESNEPTVAYQAGNESDVLIKGLKRHRRIAWYVIFALFFFGILLGNLKIESTSAIAGFLILLIPLPLSYVLLLRYRIHRAENEQAQPAAKGSLPPKESLATVVISRGILAALLVVIHEPITIGVLAVMASTALVMAVIGKPAATRSRLAKAAIYGIAAIAIYFYGAHDRSQRDMLVGKLDEYKRQHGVYPEQLDDMIPAQLPKIPKSGLTGFQYIRQEDASSYSLLYRPSNAGPCSYTPERGEWKCQAR